MVRALLWKEWREQAAIIVALLALGGGVIAAAVELGGGVSDASPFDFQGYGESGRLAFLMLALTAGTVIGGALFAGEHEAETAGILAALPATRWRLWRGKVLAGATLAAAAGAVLIAEGLALGAGGRGKVAAEWGTWIGLLTLAAFGWGAFGSVLCRSTLAACGTGLFAAPFIGSAFLLLAAVFEEATDYAVDSQFGLKKGDFTLIAAAFGSLVTPLGLSGAIFSGPDRARRESELTPGAIRTTRAVARRAGRTRVGMGVRALVWLLVRQYLLTAAVLGGLALMFGLTMLSNTAPLVVGWPAASLFLGVLTGVTGWSDEQGKGASRFWGERRLPVGRLWLAKVAGGLALTIGLSLLFLLPNLIRVAVGENVRGPYVLAVFRSGLVAGDMGLWSGRTADLQNFLSYLLLWPVYGFVAGHLSGLLFRKAVVAAGVGVLTGGAIAGMWLPSLLGGGLHHWQLWPAPLAALVTARLLVRPWSADRLAGRRPITVLATGLTAVLVMTAAGIGFRVVEVPVIPEANDDLKFANALPIYDENEAGREIRSSIARYQLEAASRLNYQVPGRLFEDDPEVRNASGGSYRSPLIFANLVHLFPKNGWPADRPDLDAWLDKVFESKWDEPLFTAAGMPLGVVEDPTTITLATNSYPLIQPLRGMASLMLARGLQKQAKGDPAAYPRYLNATLALARNARHKSTGQWALAGRSVEFIALQSLAPWLERLDGRPDLLRVALAVLARHEATVPTDPADAWLAGRTVIRTSVNGPSLWAAKVLGGTIQELSHNTTQEEVKIRADLEANLLGFSWTVPWEKERLRRVVGLGNDPHRAAEVYELTRGAPGTFEYYTPALSVHEPAAAAVRRAGILRAALRLYEAETGKPAATLDQLVDRKYLPAVPADPFDGKPFRYRLSGGERVAMEALPVSAGGPGPGIGPALYTLPGFGDNSFQAVESKGVIVSLGAVAGAWTCSELPPPNPPGLEPPDVLSEGMFDAQAAVGGGIVQWPLPPLTLEAAVTGGRVSAEVPVGSRRAAYGADDERRMVELAPGQGVLWSVGADRFDDGGKVLADPGSLARSSSGDLIYIVPLPAGKASAAKGAAK